MRQLLLLRHAKAVLGSPGMQDFDRPLAERGEKAAKAMGHYMAGHDLTPDLVLCSPARRTQMTWDIASRELPRAPSRMIDDLYDFGDGSALLAAILRLGGTAKRLMLVAHNPATQNLALSLAAEGDRALLRQMAEKYPTAAMAILSFSGENWSATAEGTGRLDAFIRPRDIMEG